MAPYVPLLMPELKAALIDPLPEVRATAAKTLGSLLKGMAQQYFEDVLPWLLETLKSEGSSVERSGAAQGLAEVLAVLGPAHVEALLPDIVAGTKSKSPFVREGHLTLFKFLPLAIPSNFQVRSLLSPLCCVTATGFAWLQSVLFPADNQKLFARLVARLSAIHQMNKHAT